MIIESAKQVVKRTLASRWGWRLGGPLLRKPGAIVLMYHRIVGDGEQLHGLPVETFNEQMQWIRRNCRVIEPAKLVECTRRGRTSRPAVLVTFDDGFRDYHDHAYPILKELGIPALVFLATSFMDGGGALWTDELQSAVLRTELDRAKCPWRIGTTMELTDRAARRRWYEAASEYLKGLPDQRCRAELDVLLSELGRPATQQRQMLTWDEVRATSDLTTYGGHTHTHPILSQVSPARARDEIATCRDRIKAETGRRPTCFAYPNGRARDFTTETKDILQSEGFELAFSTVEGIAGPDSDWMAIKRLPGGANRLPDFVWLASGLRHG